jgi:hypothetical protein
MRPQQPNGLRHDRGSPKCLTLPGALAVAPAAPWQKVLCGTLLMLVAIIVAPQARPMFWPLLTAETRMSPQSQGYLNAAEDALKMAVERLDRLNRETRLYRDPDAEVVIPGFGYGSPNALRLQIQEQVDARRVDYEQLRRAVEKSAAPFGRHICAKVERA